MQPDPTRQVLLCRALEGAANSVMITERSGRILWVNDAFCRLSGYTREETVGGNPRLLSSGRQGRDFYRAMWETIQRGRPWQGELVERRSDSSIYTVSQVISPLLDAEGRVTHFLAIQQDVSSDAEERAHIHHLAYHDIVTDLPNRALFLQLLAEALDQAAAQKRCAAVMFLDLDRFKNVNDSLGHAAGDRLLKAVAERIRACVRGSDTVARLGGDEFAIGLRNLDDAEAAKALAQKLVRSIGQPFVFDGLRVATSASIGISLYPADGERAETLLSRADAAMYQAKAQGGSSFRFAGQPSV
jgi:diguanylate cyclase (GGDEF)-like protein/PAS domain S-box-containing protein